MKKINTFYNPILWASKLSTLVECSYNLKNGMMAHTASASVKKESVYYSYDPHIYRFKDHDPVLQKLISLEDEMNQCNMFLKEKLFNKNYHNELIYTHNEFGKGCHNIVDEDGKNINEDLLKHIIALASIRNDTIKNRSDQF